METCNKELAMKLRIKPIAILNEETKEQCIKLILKTIEYIKPYRDIRIIQAIKFDEFSIIQKEFTKPPYNRKMYMYEGPILKTILGCIESDNHFIDIPHIKMRTQPNGERTIDEAVFHIKRLDSPVLHTDYNIKISRDTNDKVVIDIRKTESIPNKYIIS